VRFLCDENVDRQVVDALRQAGHMVTYIAELSPSVDDERVLADANRESALLVTSDRDFGALVFNQGKAPRWPVCIHGHLARYDSLPQDTLSAP
jgi:predicted nuclease of predicted toxin-antitoxin system